MMSIDGIVKILMRRDGISQWEAEDLVCRCQADLDAIVRNNGSLDDAEECIARCLNLEPDFLEVFLYGL